MTVFSDYENSVHDASPVECYKFVGSFKTYRYTSAERDITLNGELYTAIPIKRNAVKSGTQEDDSLNLEVEIPFNTDIVIDYAYAESPPRLGLEVYRAHRGTNFSTDWSLLWSGRVSSFSVDGRVAKIRTPSVFSRALQGDLPSVYYQNPCNHVLFDGRCKVSRGSYLTTSTVVSVSNNSIQVANDGVADSFLKAGELVNTRNGERRSIVDNVLNLLTVNYRFVDIRVGDVVDMVAGCDHSYTTCKNKFNNTLNYGGHPFIPSDNPFIGEL